MQGEQEREPLAGQQPIPLIQILPDGRLAYVTLPSASALQQPVQPFVAPAPASSAPLPVTQSAGEIKSARDRWAAIVKVMGILMLFLAVFGLATRVGLAHKMKRKFQWALWGIGLGIFLLMLVAAVLAIRAGVKKTSASAMCYTRFLVFFAVIFVIALVASSMLCLKLEKKHWKRHSNQWNQDTAEDQSEPSMPADMPPSEPQSEPQPPNIPRPPAETQTFTSSEPASVPSASTVPGEPADTHPEFQRRSDEGEASDRNDKRGKDGERDEDDDDDKDDKDDKDEKNARAFPEDALDERSKENRSRKHDKYGDRDEYRPWTKEEIKEGMMLGMFVVVLLSMGLCCSCVFCALRLAKHAKNYEALIPRESSAPYFSYSLSQPVQPMQPMQLMQPMHPVQPMQPVQQVHQAPQQAQMEMRHFQPVVPQVVQAVPLGQAGLYPNLAPLGSAVPYPRTS